MRLNLPFLLAAILAIIFIVLWLVQNRLTINASSTVISNIPYSIKSLSLFVGFQVLLFPLMVLSAALGLEAINNPIFYIGSIQAYVIPTLFNFLVFGKTYPASIYTWFLVGIPLHAIGGLLLGKLFQSKIKSNGIKQWFLLLGFLVIFEAALTILLVYTVKSDLWLEVWHLHPGPREW
jgi:hypothetical protein